MDLNHGIIHCKQLKFYIHHAIQGLPLNGHQNEFLRKCVYFHKYAEGNFYLGCRKIWARMA